MTSKEFVLWLKGFTEGVHEFNITPKQWDLLKDKLAEVKDDAPIGFPFGVPNTQTFPKWQEPHKVNPFYVGDVPLTNPLGSSGTGTANGVITTTPGYGSLTFNPSTTTQMYPSGSMWSYTNSTYRPPYTTGGKDEIVKTHNED
jgi:hypothetical protein